MLQTRPSGQYRSSALDPASEASAVLIIRDPNPCRDGWVTFGPPLSVQRRHNSTSSSSPHSRSHAMETCPWAVESAPYLHAFVQSSCNASASAVVKRDGTWR